MRVQIVVAAAANGHHPTPSSDQLDGDGEVVYGDAGYQAFLKRQERDATVAEFQSTMRTSKCSSLSDTPLDRSEVRL